MTVQSTNPAPKQESLVARGLREAFYAGLISLGMFVLFVGLKTDQNMRNDVTSIHFKQSPAHASYDWHNDPEPQYVITLSGTLAFATRNGEKFTLHPGEVLVAEDNTGTGHRWNMIDDQPWRRGYVVLKPGAKDSFIPDDPIAAKVCNGS